MDLRREQCPGISPRGLECLRVAASLAHCSTVRVQVRHDDCTLVEVSRCPIERLGGARLMSPCEFRRSVARAHDLDGQGIPVGMVGLPDGVDPTIRVTVPPGGVEHAGGIYRLPHQGGWLHAFATTAGRETQRSGSERFGVGVRGDRAIGAAFVFITARDPTDEAADVAVLEMALAHMTVDSLLADVLCRRLG